MTKKRSAWTCLVDSDGNPYKNATATKVKIAADADADDLRKQIITDDGEKVLKGISASQLKVYKNLNDLKQNQPLKSSAKLEGFGLDEESALVVVVPTEQNLAGPSAFGGILNL